MNKSLAKNSIYNVLYKTLNILFPLITSAYVARVLMADSIGKVAAAQNIAQYFTLVASMGIPTYGVKLIAQFREKNAQMDKAFSELFIINFLLSAVCSIAYYIVIFNFNYFDGKELLYAVAGLNIVFNVINVDWFYQGIQEYGYIAARSFATKILSLIFLFVFVRSADDYIIYALISSGALVANYIFNIFRIKKYVTLTFKDLKFSSHLGHIFTLFVANVAAEIYVLADTTMLDVWCDSTIVGYYTMSMKIIKVVRSLVVAVSAVFLPQMSYYYYNGYKERFIQLANKGFHILLALAVPAAAGLLLLSDDAILVVFGTGFRDSILTTKMLSISIITVAVSNFVGLQLLVTIGKERITTISTICGAFINITLNYFLIQGYQHNGAAVASLITEGVVMLIQLILSKRYVSLKFDLKKILISLLFMILSVMLIRNILTSGIIRLLLLCFVGVCVYSVSMCLLRDTFASEVLNKIKQILHKKRT